MAQRIALDSLYAAARRRAGMASSDFGAATLAFPEQCPFSLDDLLAAEIQVLSGELTSGS